jgi:hypothetical protein
MDRAEETLRERGSATELGYLSEHRERSKKIT